MFYDRLKALCDEKGVKLTKLVEELGMSRGNMSRWKSGGVPKSDTLHALADRLGVSVDYLLGVEEKKEELLNILEPNADTPEVQALIKYYLGCDGDGRVRIIHFAMNEWERYEEERKKEAERAVAELKSS